VRLATHLRPLVFFLLLNKNKTRFLAKKTSYSLQKGERLNHQFWLTYGIGNSKWRQSPAPMKYSQGILLAGVASFALFSSLNFALGVTLVALTNAPPPPNGWQAVACSADGTKFVAAAYQGGIYTSTNSGATWISNAAPALRWFSVASSDDGTKLAAVSYSGNGQVWTNSGTTWYPTTAPTSTLASYGSVSSSADGSRLFAVVAGLTSTSHAIFASADSGATWYQTAAPNLSWYAVACSADGSKVVATAYNTNVIYTSPDSGANFTPHLVPLNSWFAVSSSADGTHLVSSLQFGGVFTSADSGVTWVSNNVPGANCYAVTSSSDGSHLVAVGINTFYSSSNFGQTWTSNNPPAALLRAAACSADGLKGIVAGATGPTNPVLYAFAPVITTPPLLSLISSNAQMALAWPGSIMDFQLQQNSNLTVANWSNVTNSVLPTNGLNEVFISPTNPAGFYRLINR
jgi:hypothetical protein